VPLHEATFRFEIDHAESVYRSLAPELEDEVNPRSVTRCHTEGPATLVLTVEACDLPALRAALNMALRLVAVADEMQDIA
jgi:KEOPS complex subunit Pcc1